MRTPAQIAQKKKMEARLARLAEKEGHVENPVEEAGDRVEVVATPPRPKSTFVGLSNQSRHAAQRIADKKVNFTEVLNAIAATWSLSNEVGTRHFSGRFMELMEGEDWTECVRFGHKLQNLSLLTPGPVQYKSRDAVLAFPGMKEYKDPNDTAAPTKFASLMDPSLKVDAKEWIKDIEAIPPFFGALMTHYIHFPTWVHRDGVPKMLHRLRWKKFGIALVSHGKSRSAS